LQAAQTHADIIALADITLHAADADAAAAASSAAAAKMASSNAFGVAPQKRARGGVKLVEVSPVWTALKRD